MGKGNDMGNDKGNGKTFERLSVEDQLFVRLDSRQMPMTIAMLATFDAEGGDFDAMVAAINRRLHLVPRYRQKLIDTPWGLGRQVWVDDPEFDLAFHVRHVALPQPGGREELLTFVSRIFSHPLDFDRPLWEMWIIDLPDGRKALFHKSHHAVADGVSALDIATVLFDRTREPTEEHEAPPWQPRPLPGRVDLLLDSAATNLRTPLDMAGKLWRLARRPSEAAHGGAHAAHGIESFLAASLPPTTTTSLDQHIRDPHRRLDVVSGSLSGARAAKRRQRATVNDVALAATAGGLGKLLRSRGEDTDGLIVRTVIPVSTRSDDQHFQYGNMIAAMVAELPVGELDPWKRLSLVRQSTQAAKVGRQPTGVDFVAQVGELAPASLISIAGRVATRQPMYSLVVTNIPGPRHPLYWAGHKLCDAYFFGPNLIERTDLAVAILSYNGELNFGLTADRDVVPDLSVVAEGIAESLAEYASA